MHAAGAGIGGDLDAVLSHESGVAFHRNRTAPAAGFDPLRDHPRLPNEPAQLRDVRIDFSGDCPNIHFVAYDAESDPVWIVAEYQEWGRATSWVR